MTSWEFGWLSGLIPLTSLRVGLLGSILGYHGGLRDTYPGFQMVAPAWATAAQATCARWQLAEESSAHSPCTGQLHSAKVPPLEPPLRWWCHDDRQSNSHRKHQCHSRHLSVSIAKLADSDWHRMRDVHLGPDLLNLSSVRAPMIFRWRDQKKILRNCVISLRLRGLQTLNHGGLVAHRCHEKQFWQLRWHCSLHQVELGSLRHIASSTLFPLETNGLVGSGGGRCRITRLATFSSPVFGSAAPVALGALFQFFHFDSERHLGLLGFGEATGSLQFWKLSSLLLPSGCKNHCNLSLRVGVNAISVGISVSRSYSAIKASTLAKPCTSSDFTPREASSSSESSTTAITACRRRLTKSG